MRYDINKQVTYKLRILDTSKTSTEQDLSLKCSAWKGYNLSFPVEVFKSLTKIGSTKIFGLKNLWVGRNLGQQKLLGLKTIGQK